MNLHSDTPESLTWQAQRDASAATYLAGLPGRQRLAEQVARHLVDSRRSPLIRRGNRWFQTAVLEPAAEHPVVVVRDAPAGQPRTLVDPNELTAKRGIPVALAWIAPSPDGSVLAYAVTAAGTEIAEVALIDVTTGETLPEQVPWNVTSPVSWLPDSSAFWCAGREVADGVFRMPIYHYVLGRPAGEAVRTPDGLVFPHPIVSDDGRYIALATGNTEPRLDWIWRDGAFVPFLQHIEGAVAGRFLGEHLVAIVDGGAPRGRLVRIPVATAGDESTWTELVPLSSDVLRYVDVVEDVIVVGYLRDAVCRVRLLDQNGTTIEELVLPGDGVVSSIAVGASHPSLPMFETGRDEISFVHSTFDTSPGVYRYVVSERRLEVVTPPAVHLDGLTVTTITSISADGTEIPAHVVHRGGLDTSMPQPTLISGYGGFNLAWLPSYLAEHAAWVEAGGIFVLAHLRGGSDFGTEWWQQGSREYKQHTFDDLFALAEGLITTGVTTPSQLAVKGESNGGLLAGAAIVQRPDLWAAVIADVPILDLLGMVNDPLTYAIGRGEYGDPLDPVEAAWLEAISPVHNIRPSSYPAVLVSAGANDPRCPAWHSRVFVERLQHAQRGDAPLLLRVYGDQGHGAAGLAATADKHADWLAFAAAATGLTL